MQGGNEDGGEAAHEIHESTLNRAFAYFASFG